MSKYTTGELAKLCKVSVRTVQYYDNRNILTPSELSEGGRRLYSEQDLRRLQTICFLRGIGLSINAIGDFLSQPEPEKTLTLLLDQQEAEVRKELQSLQKNLDALETLRRELKTVETFSVETIPDIAQIMSGKKKMKKMRWMMVLTGLPVTALQWWSIIRWIMTGSWWLFAVWAVVAIIWGTVVSRYYFKKTAYICPECHHTFKPTFKEAFWANHTPNTRKLTCTCCGEKRWCVEVWGEEAEHGEV